MPMAILIKDDGKQIISIVSFVTLYNESVLLLALFIKLHVIFTPIIRLKTFCCRLAW